MQLSIILCAILTLSSAHSVTFYAASPNLRNAYPFSYGVHSSSLVTPTQQQYHTQDDLGQYAYGYREPLSAKQEVRSLDGITRGSYSYRDAEGKLQTVEYTADGDGFRVAATNLPRPVPIPQYDTAATTTGPADTADVAAARAAHFAAHQAAKLRLAEYKSAPGESPAVDSDSSAIELRQSFGNTFTNNIVTAPTGTVASNVGHSASATGDTSTTIADKTNQLNPDERDNSQVGITLARKIAATKAVIPTTLPLTYQYFTIPRVYTYGYPQNSRFLAPNFYY